MTEAHSTAEDLPVPARPEPAQSIENFDGVSVLVCGEDGPPLDEPRAVSDLVGEASYLGVSWVALPAARLGDDFFELRSGVAGDVLQKFVNFRVGLAVVGDVSRHTTASNALRDLVRESNRGSQAWFVPDLGELRTRLARLARASAYRR